MTGKFKTMTLVEEAELDRLRQRQIKDYNPALNSLTKIQDQIFKIFDDKELTDEGKCKILAQLQDRFGFLLIKFKMLGSLLRMFCPLILQFPYQHLMTMRVMVHPPACWKQTQKAIFLPVKASTKRKAMLPLKLSRLQRPLRI